MNNRTVILIGSNAGDMDKISLVLNSKKDASGK